MTRFLQRSVLAVPFLLACLLSSAFDLAAAIEDTTVDPNAQKPIHHGAVSLLPLQGLAREEAEVEEDEWEQVKNGQNGQKESHALVRPRLYTSMLEALNDMEENFYSCSIGTWPDAIDWTAEVVSSQVSTSLLEMSDYAKNRASAPICQGHGAAHENIINRYFSHIVSFYFGEDAFSLRTQAYDDMLWVVLSWLESVKFINLHSNLHYATAESRPLLVAGNSSWYARQFVPQFAHRARLFYDLASRGWDTTLCGGGMVWNSRLAPYKNAITNQLFITASIWMYLYFPGDDDSSPFLFMSNAFSQNHVQENDDPPAKPHDPLYLSNAIAAYDWLRSSGLLNELGLYADGFHIRGWRGGRNPSNGTGKCDLRDEKVYTYNQGVILSGLRGLWEATGNRTYLAHGHDLVQNVIKATGWENRDDEDHRWDWAGLGRGGVLEEECDWSGSCSQDGQTFKGIFFWHFASFCSPLPHTSHVDPKQPWFGDDTTRALHRNSCRAYEEWVKKNAQAAWVTRDDDGLMGSWWGRHWSQSGDVMHESTEAGGRHPGAPPVSTGTDYRNRGVPSDLIWQITVDPEESQNGSPHADSFTERDLSDALRDSSLPIDVTWAHRDAKRSSHSADGDSPATSHAFDLNDRGRGRTVETQSGGLAVLRAAWKLQAQREQEHKV